MYCGIVGLPNVGKSTLFNVLTKTAAAQAANYPFCTIDPNIGKVAVPDERLAILAQCAHSQNILPAQLEFVDIAGLVKGASKGEGLGNQFLGHIREVNAILQVVRCFSDDNIIHVEGKTNPSHDVGVIETELLLADLESVNQRLGKRKPDEQTPLLKKAKEVLEKGFFASTALDCFDPEVKALQLLTTKPMIYIANVSDDFFLKQGSYEQEKKYIEDLKITVKGAPVLPLSVRLESELAGLSSEEQKELMKDFGISCSGLDSVIRCAYDFLNLITYFTVGPKETRAWTIKKGTKAPEAAGVIHTDFQKGFIKAEVVSYIDFIANGSLIKAREEGKARQEGKEYIVVDGDVILFRFNV